MQAGSGMSAPASKQNDPTEIIAKLSATLENIFIWCFFLAVVELAITIQGDRYHQAEAVRTKRLRLYECCHRRATTAFSRGISICVPKVWRVKTAETLRFGYGLWAERASRSKAIVCRSHRNSRRTTKMARGQERCERSSDRVHDVVHALGSPQPWSCPSIDLRRSRSRLTFSKIARRACPNDKKKADTAAPLGNCQRTARCVSHVRHAGAVGA